MLYDLNLAIRQARAAMGDEAPAVLGLVGHYHNLLRNVGRVVSAKAAPATELLLLDAGEAGEALASFRMAARADDPRGPTMLGRAAERG